MVDPNITSRFNEIYDSTYKPVMSFITAKCSNTADIHDIAQDTYVELYQILERRGVDYIKNDKALALRIAKQKLSRYYSLMGRLRLFVPMTVTNDGGEEVELSDLEADSFLTEDFTVNQILLEEAMHFIQQKPQDVKKVFYLFYDVGQSIPEIAQALSMSESNVKHRLYRTLKELRTLLQ
jgi:RNA polymerase sigma-70 factor (ECF subfamily)